MDLLDIRRQILAAEDPLAATRHWLGYATIYTQVVGDMRLASHVQDVMRASDIDDTFRMCSQAAHIAAHTMPVNARLDLRRADGSTVHIDDHDDDGDTLWVLTFGLACARSDAQTALELFNSRLTGPSQRTATLSRLFMMARVAACAHLGIESS